MYVYLFMLFAYSASLLHAEVLPPPTLSEQDAQHIDDLIRYLSMPYYKILPRAGKIHSVGNKARSIHPLLFISYIVGDPVLCRQLKTKMYQRPFVWSQFVQGFGGSMERALHRREFPCYVDACCEATGISPQRLNHLIHHKSWEKIIVELMHQH
ncbi:MAG: hypothetical protein VXZ72_04775 [Chlamydiota bacterium]|nr:hypothetical protein [Chlamydiota bacterium]